MTKALYQLLFCAVFVSVVSGLAPTRHGLLAAEDARRPAPPQEKVEEALALIRDAYEADYRAAKESGEPEQLIAQLNVLASGEADPVRKYALFVEAENVAATHDNFKKAVELLDARAELFRIDGLALRSDLLKRLAGPKVSADLELCDQAMDTAQKAMRSERFDLASEAAVLAVSIAKAVDREQKAAMRKQRKKDGGNFVAPPPIGVEIVKNAAALQAQVMATEKLFEQYGDAVQKAKSSPDSPSANAVIGSYLCFVRGDWKAGLPALAKSNLSEFASLAADEMKLAAASGPMDPQQAFSLAGKWWSEAESKGLSDDREAAIKDHAAGFYAVIVDRLEGALEKKLATSRLRGFAKPQPAPVQPAAVDDPLAATVAAGSAEPSRSDTVGKKRMVIVQGGRLPEHSALAGSEVATFRISSFETTWGEWRDVRDFGIRNGFDLEGVGFGAEDAFPARGISWFAAIKWCNAKSLKEKLRPVYLVGGAPYRSGESIPDVDPVADGYRLPTDAEWEWAARGGIRSKGSEFSGSNDINEVAWYAGNNTPIGPKPVGTKAPNELGLYDMTGNVWEWCWDAVPSGDRRFRSASYDDPPVALVVRAQHATRSGNNGEDIGFRYACNAEERGVGAAKNVRGNPLTDLKFVVEANSVVITGYSGMDPQVTIPQVIQGRPVIAIGKGAFKENVALTRVVLPRWLTRIDAEAFSQCRRLSEVVIPEGVRAIHDQAFSKTALTTLNLPGTLESLGGGNLPDQLESINIAAECKYFRTIDGILYDAKAERVVQCPRNRQKAVVLPNSVYTIAPCAFNGCSGIESISLPASLVAIGFDAFHSCTRLRTIDIPARVSNIEGGGWCFLHSSDLVAINVDPANATYTSVDGLLYDKNVTTLLGCPGGKKGTVVIPSTVTKINGWVFHGCNRLERIVIPKSVAEINEKAFAGCNAVRNTAE
jgi:formylglycine-generating enzyme required for sulfatase activity